MMTSNLGNLYESTESVLLHIEVEPLRLDLQHLAVQLLLTCVSVTTPTFKLHSSQWQSDSTLTAY